MTESGNTALSPARIAGLDLIRGFAILLVLLRHAWPEVFGGAGIVGVVTFFALSGYLITGVIKRDIDVHGKLRYGRFYRNRAFRLLPALCFMLFGFGIIESTFNILGHRQEIWPSVFAALTYTMNIPGIPHGSSAVSHLWTLATEEQFYLVWPAIVVAGIRFRRMRWFVVFSAVASLAFCAVTIAIVWPQVERVYSLPTSWAVAMIIGAAANLGKSQLVRYLPKRASARHIAAAAAMSLLIILSFAPEPKGSALAYLIGGPLVAICTVVLIDYAGGWATLPTPTLSPLLWLGTVSYATYLWNFPIATWMGGRPLAPLQALASIALSVGAATVSWWLIEVPFSRLKRRLDMRARSELKAARPLSDLKK
ncbi:O-acetyltransferase OatA [Arthrobacter sp. Bi26]|uniref:acyltransferase family protein n=1 Tax=Arthrobacter sp. Bi26 TaxID=2822350 RepID=UPI001D602BB1|nr:O-acetyltransferase OatA [Arthrobacter sp. Bi26]